jgi:hypothetical protein
MRDGSPEFKGDKVADEVSKKFAEVEHRNPSRTGHLNLERLEKKNCRAGCRQ